MFESPVLKRCSTKPTTSFCKEQTILSFIFFSSPAAGVDPASTFPPSPRLRPFQPRFLVPPCKMISTLRERVEIPKVEDSPRYKYIYTNTNTQIQIHKYPKLRTVHGFSSTAFTTLLALQLPGPPRIQTRGGSGRD